MAGLLAALEASPLAVFMREDLTAFPLAESLHVVGVTFLVGSIAVIDLRLLGVSARNHAVTHLAGEILPWTWGAFALAAITGFLMFASAATQYAANGPFLLKMGLLGAAGLNMLVFHRLTWRSVALWDVAAPAPAAARVAGGLSLLAWVGVVVCGRWIGFV